MANTIVDFSGDKAVEMSNGRFARQPIAGLFSGWTTLRVALLVRMNDSGANITGTPRFMFGLCAGTSNIPGDATVTHACGCITNNATWTRTAGPPGYYSPLTIAPSTYINTTIATGTNLSTTSALGFSGTIVNAMVFIDITKGSPNYSLRLLSRTNTASGAPTQSDFNAQSVATTPAFTGHTYTAAQTIAVDEVANGTFDSAFVWWNQVTPAINILSWRVVLLA